MYCILVQVQVCPHEGFAHADSLLMKRFAPADCQAHEILQVAPIDSLDTEVQELASAVWPMSFHNTDIQAHQPIRSFYPLVERLCKDTPARYHLLSLTNSKTLQEVKNVYPQLFRLCMKSGISTPGKPYLQEVRNQFKLPPTGSQALQEVRNYHPKIVRLFMMLEIITHRESGSTQFKLPPQVSNLCKKS